MPEETIMAKNAKPNGKARAKPRFRSQLWFDNPDDPGALQGCLLYTSDAADEL